MKNSHRTALAAGLAALALWLAPAFGFAQAAASAHEGFVPLFNGKDLKGWKGDPALWKVEGGAIVGSTDGSKIKENKFLISDAKYKNFVLRAKIKLRNGNSGIQFRSEEMPGFVAAGYQADIAPDYWGMIYEERKRGLMDYWKKLAPEEQKKLVANAKKDDWNEMEITADGDHLKITLNGATTCDIHDPAGAKEGILALQLHAGPDMKVEFKDLEIKELD